MARILCYKLQLKMLQYTVLKTNIVTINPKPNHLSNNVLLAFYYRWKLHRKEEGIFTLDDVSSKIPKLNYNNLLHINYYCHHRLYSLSVFSLILSSGQKGQVHKFLLFYYLNSLITFLIIIILHLWNFNYVETLRKFIIDKPVVTKLIHISNPVAHYC